MCLMTQNAHENGIDSVEPVNGHMGISCLYKSGSQILDGTRDESFSAEQEIMVAQAKEI